MKRIGLFLLCLVMVLSLCACDVKPEEYTVEYNGKTYTVRPRECTISDGKYTYNYVQTGNSQKSTTTIFYPNGTSYQMMSEGIVTTSYGNSSFQRGDYADPSALRSVLATEPPARFDFNINFYKWFLVLVSGGLGVSLLKDPQRAWEMEYGWRYKNAEPTEKALNRNRVMGVIGIVTAVIALFFL